MENGVKRFFYDDFNLRLRVIPHKKKDKIGVLKEVSAQFEVLIAKLFEYESE